MVIFFLLNIPDQKMTTLSTKAKLAQLDVYGSALILPGSVCLVLALQWGGLTYAVSWNILAVGIWILNHLIVEQCPHHRSPSPGWLIVAGVCPSTSLSAQDCNDCS